jgi:[citrate (pro-3S)-lyase] ligase
MYELKRIWITRVPADKKVWEDLLLSSGLVPDEQVDYTVGIYDRNKLIATGSTYQNIIKLVAVDPEYQSENLLTRIVMALTSKLHDEGIIHFFLYTKPCVAVSFTSLGFKEIVRTENILFMEQGSPDFSDYLTLLDTQRKPASHAGAIVMNANPFTKGHLYLVETAAAQVDVLYLFVLSDDRSDFSTAERLMLVEAGTKHLPNVVILPTRDYQVSSATFPSYFLKDQAMESVARIQATLDATLFKERIAPVLHIKTRYVGEEPLSPVTEVYNESMRHVFSGSLDLVVIPRLGIEGQVISATRVRKALKEDDFQTIKKLVPPTTYVYLAEKYDKNKFRGEKSGN